ncbi:hypothetical protein JOF56_011005 [Kibdelosporangium banguiense]|uniref:DUF2637 domain-containing protein n=1 Tax=Kibdelosporangium banguiense TaxID=1365924 RepID=A0ABS4U375_9PSEU|nr:DUF2637 domain-containing protein [Kibdelosporangium banguiense]MBP2330620.1 hypothetical protein [Kibdelosporangium banguiense]
MNWREDRRADEAAHAALARQDRALAADQRRQDAAARAEQARRDRAAAAQVAAAGRAERDARRAARRAARRERWPELGMAALWATMIVLPIALAWAAQAQFALETLGFPAPLNHGFPAAIETGAWLCAFEAHRRIKRRRSAGSLPRWMWMLAGIAAAINAAHGLRDGGVVAGLAFGVLSLLGVLLHSIRQGLDREIVSGRAGQVWRRLRYPLLSLAAAGIRAAREIEPDTAWRLAWEDRFGVGPDSTRRDRRLARVIVRRESARDRKAARAGEITIIDGRVQRGFSTEVQAYVDAERAAAIARADEAVAHAESIVQGAQDALTAAGMVFGPAALREGTAPAGYGGYTGREQGELVGRPAELLTLVRAAIAAGELPQYPAVKAITRRFEGFGTPTAQRVRDALRAGHTTTHDAAGTDRTATPAPMSDASGIAPDRRVA